MNRIVATLVVLLTAEPEVDTGLQWRAPPECPSQVEVAALLEEERRDVPASERSELQTSAVVTATEAGRWRVDIAIRGGGGELRRVLDLDSCAATAEAVALVYGLALSGRIEPSTEQGAVREPDDEQSSGEAEDDAVPEPGSEPAPPPIDPPAPEAPTREPVPKLEPATSARSNEPRRRAPRTPPYLAIHGGVGGNVGGLGRGSGHLLASIGVGWRWVRLELRADHAIVRRFRVEAEGIGANVSATTGGLSSSIPIPAGPVEVLPGVHLRAGGARARGIGGVARKVRWVPWVVAGIGSSLVWMAGRRWGLRVGAALEVPLLRHTFTFDAVEVSRTQQVGGVVWIGPEVRLLGGVRRKIPGSR